MDMSVGACHQQLMTNLIDHGPTNGVAAPTGGIADIVGWILLRPTYNNPLVCQ